MSQETDRARQWECSDPAQLYETGYDTHLRTFSFAAQQYEKLFYLKGYNM